MSSRAIARYKPTEPKIWFEDRGDILITHLELNPAPGVVLRFKSRTNLAAIERRFRRGEVSGIEGIFGKIWKGIKKTVKKVGKATGLNKVLKAAKKVALPLVKVIPGVGNAVSAIETAADMTTAIIAKKSGKKKLAKRVMKLAAKRAKGNRLDKREVKAQTARVYKLIVSAD